MSQIGLRPGDQVCFGMSPSSDPRTFQAGLVSSKIARVDRSHLDRSRHMGSPAISSSRRLARIQRQLEEHAAVHCWYPPAVVECFAYLFPADGRFTQTDLENLFDRQRLDRSQIQSSLTALQQSKVLLMEICQAENWKPHYLME